MTNIAHTKMKSLAKLVLLGMVAALVIFFCQRNRHSQSETPILAATIPPAIATMQCKLAAAPKASNDRSPEVIQSASPPKCLAPVENDMAAIHLKLRRWLEAQKNGAEDGETQSMLELQAMLTDTNAAVIIQSLSADELETPFGFEAIRRWMNADPVQASNWFAARPDTTRDETGAIAQGWAANSAGLQNYAAQLPDTAWKQTFLVEAGSQLSSSDPVAAIQLAQQMNPGNDQTSLLQSVACNWVTSDPNAALDWIAGVKDPALQEQLVASAAQSYALTDPALATGWLVSMVKSDDIVKNAALNIIQTWVTKDASGAANWASQLPDGDVKTAAVNYVSKYWQQTDPAAARTWIQNLRGVTSVESWRSYGITPND
jgi:hypothetical protein